MITLIIILTIISVLSTSIVAYRLHKYTYNPKIDILQTLDGKYIPTVNSKFIEIYCGKTSYSKYPKICYSKKEAENYLYDWLNKKGLGLKSVGLDKDIEL